MILIRKKASLVGGFFLHLNVRNVRWLIVGRLFVFVLQAYLLFSLETGQICVRINQLPTTTVRKPRLVDIVVVDDMIVLEKVISLLEL